jgi:exoribonuclease-2
MPLCCAPVIGNPLLAAHAGSCGQRAQDPIAAQERFQPMSHRQGPRYIDLHELARQAMFDRGMEPDFPPEVVSQVKALGGPALESNGSTRDLRNLPWCSIDNDDSRDLDQLTVAEGLGEGRDRVLVAIADVDSLVHPGSAVDDHARANTTSVYTAGGVFPMLPERLSTDLTSLNAAEDRLAVVISYVVDEEGAVSEPAIFRASVRNKAKLAYHGVAAWLDSQGEMPGAMAAAPGVADQIRLQDAIAQRLKERRHEHGALNLETIEPRAVVQDGQIVDLHVERQNRAQELIEDFMIAANGVTTRFLTERGFPTFRRVVRSPERWDRIRDLAAEYGERLPSEPDSKPLAEFLMRRRQADPLRFPDLSLAVVKMMGAGEYVVNRPGREPIGHFGLAVRDYSHSTAPNRRFPDIVTQRLLKSALAGRAQIYPIEELNALADHCTTQEDAARKVERQIRKSAAALLLSDRIGQRFDGLVTGASPKGTYVRTFRPPVEGRVMRGEQGLDVGDRVAVELLSVDVERGYIDFARARR